MGGGVEMRSMGGACGALRGLPGSAVAAIRTGRRRQGEDGWMVEILFDEAGRMAGVNRRSRSLEAGADARHEGG